MPSSHPETGTPLPRDPPPPSPGASGTSTRPPAPGWPHSPCPPGLPPPFRTGLQQRRTRPHKGPPEPLHPFRSRPGPFLPGASGNGSGWRRRDLRRHRGAEPGGTMRFRFCGDLDCPDWVLAEISTLAKISSVKLKLICAQVLRDMLGEAMEYEKILKLTSDAKLESGDVKATIAVLGFILSSAAKHNVDSESLSSELQQLGLPKEHASGLCRSYEEKQSCLQDRLRACSLRLSRLGSVGWRVDYTLSSSELWEVNEPLVHLTFNLRDGQRGRADTIPVTLSADKFQVLLAELKQAQALMNTLL
ncbi:COMM domain-containing protein 4 [Heliangelus exortis]|uniref:COMM domain-containing protein 4 n=1 Tax=Heliangelus exortis TaxID=472823 RepID=UPI003A8D7658